MAYLDSAVARTGAGDEGTTAGVSRIRAGAGAGIGAAGFLDAALNICCSGAVTGLVVALGCAVACVLACAGFTGNGA